MKKYRIGGILPPTDGRMPLIRVSCDRPSGSTTKRDFDWRIKCAIIMGGSQGFGLVIARLLDDQGARIAFTTGGEEDINIAANGGDFTDSYHFSRRK